MVSAILQLHPWIRDNATPIPYTGNKTPHLVGKQVHTILPIITEHNLNIRLIDQKKKQICQRESFLTKHPAAGTTIKSNQPLFIVTTKKPLALRAPRCIGMNSDELHQQLQLEGIHPRIYHLPHPYPEKICFAQSPQPDEPLEKNKLIIYVSSGNNKPIIWPDFTDIPLQHVINFLDDYHIEPQIINDCTHREYATDDYIVIDQRPFAGTLVTLDETKPLSVQLRINPMLHSASHGDPGGEQRKLRIIRMATPAKNNRAIS